MISARWRSISSDTNRNDDVSTSCVTAPFTKMRAFDLWFQNQIGTQRKKQRPIDHLRFRKCDVEIIDIVTR